MTPAGTVMTTRVLVASQPSTEVAILHNNVNRFRAVRTYVLAALSAIGLIASTTLLIAQSSGAWTNTGTLNTPRTAHTATLLASGQVLVVGGENAARTFLTSAELYNPGTGNWAVTGSTATPRLDHTATLLPNRAVLVAGGYLVSIHSTRQF